MESLSSLQSQNRSRAHTGRGELDQEEVAAESLWEWAACWEALAEAADLSACGDPCLHLPRSSGGSERVSDTDTLEIEFMDLYGFSGDRWKEEIEMGFVDTHPGLDCSYNHKQRPRDRFLICSAHTCRSPRGIGSYAGLRGTHRCKGSTGAP